MVQGWEDVYVQENVMMRFSTETISKCRPQPGLRASLHPGPDIPKGLGPWFRWGSLEGRQEG